MSVNVLENTFSPLSNDLTFKYVFSHENILKSFLNLFLDYIDSTVTCEIVDITPESYIIPNNKKIKSYFGDIVATLSNGDIISIEMYSNKFSENEYNKSFAYTSRLFSNQIEKNKINYEEMHKVISLNLIPTNYKRVNKEIINSYRIKNDILNISIDNNILIYLLRFDLTNKMSYNLNEHEFITILRLLNCKSLEEMEKYQKGGKSIVDEVIEYVKEWNLESSKNGLERYIEEKQQETAEEVRKKVSEEVRKETRVETIEERNFDIAKNLLNKKMKIQDIMDVTGLTKKQVLSLK